MSFWRLRSRRPGRVLAAAICATTLLGLATCDLPPPTAPTGATLVISANPPSIGLGGDQSSITVQLNRTTGAAVPDGTVVTFTSSLGSIPLTATSIDGIVKVMLTSGSDSGTATVTAQSGTADQSASVDVVIGPAPASLVLTAEPATLGREGGKSVITAFLANAELEPVDDVDVVFSTTAGTLDTGGNPVTTGSNGRAKARLRTDRTATVTATAGNLSDTIVVTVDDPNLGPTASFVFSPTAPERGDTVRFNASDSSDPDGSIVRYDWDYGDGVTARGMRSSHVYTETGTYVVLLVVTDDQGATATSSSSVTVAGRAPIASFTFSPGAPSAGSSVSFDASTSSDDGRIVEYRWSWGDGTSPTVQGEGGSRTSHTFDLVGTYTVTLTVRDDDGNEASTTATVTVS